MSSDARKNLLLFFDRPTEPCFMQKGDDNAVFQIPDHYYTDKYKAVSTTVSNRFGADAGRSIPVRNIALPDLSFPMELGQREQFSLFVPKHRRMAGRLIDIFMGMRDLEDLQSVCSYCQLRVNPYMFNYCLSVAILHRPDTKGLDIPTFAETFPDKFVDPKVIRRAREVSSVVTSGARIPITIPMNYTASENEPEQRLAYFREDIGINLHHWHWHLVYPFDAADRSLVLKDRRGELLYYMHHQIMARYDVERFCNGLSRVRAYGNLRDPVPQAYFPKLDSQVASRAWPPRFENTPCRDIDRPVDLIKVDISEMDSWRERILAAIDSQSVLMPNGRQQPLTEETGIDVLGNLAEASILSPNISYYGDYHNMLHLFIAYSHDPDHRHLEQYGVIGDPSVTMRDPAFYLLHRHVSDVFDLYKAKLPAYGADRLDFPGIRVSSVSLEGSGGRDRISTFWERSIVDFSRGLDFTPRGPVLARFTHLQHQEFTYVIEVNNTTSSPQEGTIRIFMAPTSDENGQPLSFDDQRRFMIEMDKFSQPLRPGNNTIRRRSVDSSVTIPYERTFRNQSGRQGDPGTAAAAEFDFCGCGWPQHMLVPKGNAQGFPMVLFVMVSNWSDDKIVQDLVGTCNDAASYCGIRDRKYPDRRAMGFPFDRPVPSAVTLGDFLQPNMAVRNITINFTDRVQDRGQQ